MQEQKGKTWTLIRILSVRLRFIFVFIIIGLIVGNWKWIMNAVDILLLRPASVGVGVKVEPKYFCPMDPQVVSDVPGKCPICGMALSLRKPPRLHNIEVATEEVTYRTLVREIRTVGFIEYDERRLAQIIARVEGRVDKLFADFTGIHVRKNDPLVWIYSPDLVSTQQEYLTALKALEEIAKQSPATQEVYEYYCEMHPEVISKEPGTCPKCGMTLSKRVKERIIPADDPAVQRAYRLVEASKERLRLWGITDEQIQELTKTKKAENHLRILSPIEGTVVKKMVVTGQEVTKGMELYTVADLAHLWMQAEIFESDLSVIREGQTVEIISVAYPAERFTGIVSFISPTVDPTTRTTRVRVEVHNTETKLKPGMYVSAALHIAIGKTGEVFYECCKGCPDMRSDHPEKCPRCAEMMTKAGGLPEGKKYEYRCSMDGAVRDTPGPCPKCGMELTETHKIEKKEEARTIYFCPMHPAEVFDKPGECRKCAGMKLEERKLEPGSKVIYACAEHPDTKSDKPGKCTLCGKDMAFRIESPPVKIEETFQCPMHPDKSLPAQRPCPTCGTDLKHVEQEKSLSVPVSAVIDTGVKKIVFVDSGHGTYDAVEVILGPRAGEYYPVYKGVAAGTRVVTKGAYLLDAEARINPSAAGAYFGASGHEHKK